MNPKRFVLFALVSLIALSLTSCSDDDPTQPPGDTTPPEVVTIDPQINAIAVATDESITIIFSEDMDPATAAGNVSLTSGTVTTLTWMNARTLEADHTPWTQGAEVTVTVGTGFKDVAGNALSAEASSRFWTVTSVVSLVSTIPADSTVDVVRKQDRDGYQVRVNQEDLGKVIGKGGQTARALRTLLTAASAQTDQRIGLEIVE